MTSIPLSHAPLGPFEARATGCYPLRQYYYWKACFQSKKKKGQPGIASILVNLSPMDDDTLAHKHRDGFKILMFIWGEHSVF